jgi:uncharacterized protein
MDQRITLITLGVEDLAASRAFYERLGWQRALKAAEGVAFYQAGRMALALWPRADLAKDAGVAIGPPTEFHAVSVAQNLASKAEVDAAMAEAGRAGARIVKPAVDTFYGGYAGYFADPDGFLWEIAWNPGFPLGEDGGITVPD